MGRVSHQDVTFPKKTSIIPMGSYGILWVFTKDIGYPPLELSFRRDWFGGWFQGVGQEKCNRSSLKLIVGSMRMVDLPWFTYTCYTNGWCLWSFMQVNMPFWWMLWVSKFRNCPKFSFGGVVNGLKVGETRGPPKRLGKQKLTSHTVKQTAISFTTRKVAGGINY